MRWLEVSTGECVRDISHLVSTGVTAIAVNSVPLDTCELVFHKDIQLLAVFGHGAEKTVGVVNINKNVQTLLHHRSCYRF